MPESSTDEQLSKSKSRIQCFVSAALAMLLMWIAHPPLSASWPLLGVLGWIAPLPLLSLIHRQHKLQRGDYLAIWAAATFYWIIFMCGLRNAHPALIPGWMVLSLYLASYVPLFVGLSRQAVHAWRMPFPLAVACVWVGLELIRGWAFTGFSAGLLGHTQAAFPIVIQCADLAGTYTISFAMMLFVASAAQFRQLQMDRRDLAVLRQSAEEADVAIAGGENVGRENRDLWFCLSLAIAAPLSVLAYGGWRLSQAEALAQAKPLLSAALIQRNDPVAFEYSERRERQTVAAYTRGTIEALREEPIVQLVVWPESTFTGGNPYRIIRDDFQLPPSSKVSKAEAVANLKGWQREFEYRVSDLQLALAGFTQSGQPPTLLVGSGVARYTGQYPQAFSGALLLEKPKNPADSGVSAWYGKRHLVMFGEYIPFANWMPWLYSISPLGMGTTPGDAPISVDVAGAKIAPNICFETMVERVTGNHLRQLIAEQQQVDLIVNITNDAWFGTSAILDHHRRCTQLIAVAHRRPVIMAANTGPTSWIDGSGRVLSAAAHGDATFVLASPTRDSRFSLYLLTGDMTVWPLGLFCIALTISGWRTRRNSQAQERNNSEAS